jgi:hypothetical protein
MCRSIKTLRPPFTADVGPDDVRAAALQYVRKVVGMRSPAPHNAAAFEAAVDAVTEATQVLLRDVVVRGPARRPAQLASDSARSSSTRPRASSR